MADGNSSRGSVFSGVREKWLPLYEKLRERALKALGDFEVKETSASILWKRGAAFAEITAKKESVTVAFSSDMLHPEWNAAKTLRLSKNRVTHYFEVTDNADFDFLVENMKGAAALSVRKRNTSADTARVKADSIDGYIAQFPAEIQKRLAAIRDTVKKAAPAAVEKISWGMPTFWQKENLIHFAAMKRHIGLYPGADGVEAFSGELGGFTSSKGGIQLPNDRDLPLDLIARITRYRVKKAEGT